MRFSSFLEEKISFVLFQASFIFILDFLLILHNVNKVFILFLSLFLVFYNIFYLTLSFLIIKKEYTNIVNLVDNLDDKYLISEVLAKPRSIINKAYFYALKSACKSMNDKVSNLELEKEDYEEYVEAFAHEIKMPISVLSLSLQNSNDNNLLEEVKKIETKVEQMLYYARSEVTEKDYFVKELNLNDILHPILLNYKNNILKNKVSLKVASLNYKVYTDEKWLTFIISQIIENSLKYFDKKEKLIEIDALENKNNVILIIKDNGAGIKESDLKRVFDKGFTGTNRKKEYSTGIGLYLAKKLCERLNLDINISSLYKKYTEVEIVFPKTNIYKMN